jgi:hypothetical protein
VIILGGTRGGLLLVRVWIPIIYVCQLVFISCADGRGDGAPELACKCTYIQYSDFHAKGLSAAFFVEVREGEEARRNGRDYIMGGK